MKFQKYFRTFQKIISECTISECNFLLFSANFAHSVLSIHIKRVNFNTNTPFTNRTVAGPRMPGTITDADQVYKIGFLDGAVPSDYFLFDPSLKIHI